MQPTVINQLVAIERAEQIARDTAGRPATRTGSRRRLRWRLRRLRAAVVAPTRATGAARRT